MHVWSLLGELKSQQPDLVNEMATISWEHFGDDHPVSADLYLDILNGTNHTWMCSIWKLLTWLFFCP